MILGERGIGSRSTARHGRRGPEEGRKPGDAGESIVCFYFHVLNGINPRHTSHFQTLWLRMKSARVLCKYEKARGWNEKFAVFPRRTFLALLGFRSSSEFLKRIRCCVGLSTLDWIKTLNFLWLFQGLRRHAFNFEMRDVRKRARGFFAFWTILKWCLR